MTATLLSMGTAMGRELRICLLQMPALDVVYMWLRQNGIFCLILEGLRGFILKTPEMSSFDI